MPGSSSSRRRQYPPLAQIREHPAFHTALWDLVPHQGGLLPVAADRGGVINVHWEVHGDGPVKILLLCGLGLTKVSYQRQTLHFGHTHGDKYSLLLIENRGVGGSDKPYFRWYSTSEMAHDAIEVLDHLGWGLAGRDNNNSSSSNSGSSDSDGSSRYKREVHVMGISMGGMIAQELAYLAPERIASLGLVSTSAAFTVDTTARTFATVAAEEQPAAPGAADTSTTAAAVSKPDDEAEEAEKEKPPKLTLYESISERFAFMMPKTLEHSIQYFSERVYSPSWTFSPDDATLPTRDTPKCTMPPPDINGGEYGRFSTNYERCAAQDVLRREKPPFAAQFSRFGFWAQMFGAGLHRKSEAQLVQIADKVGRERIWVVHGDADAMIHVGHGRRLVSIMKPGFWAVEKGMGHGPIVERAGWFNDVLAERCRVGEELRT